MVASIGRQHCHTSIVRDDDRLYVVEDPIHVQKLIEREPGEPIIGHRRKSMVRIENPNGVQQ